MLAGLGACTTSQPSTANSSASVSATPSQSPTWVPVRPDTTKAEGLDGAMATARYFLSLYPYVYQSGDLSEWNAMSHPDCQFCANVSTNVADLHASGGRTEGGEVALEGAPAIQRNDAGTEVIVSVLASHAAIREISASRSVVSTVPAARNPIDVLVWWHGTEWLVHGVKVGDPK
jgi:hypothetical protein